MRLNTQYRRLGIVLIALSCFLVEGSALAGARKKKVVEFVPFEVLHGPVGGRRVRPDYNPDALPEIEVEWADEVVQFVREDSRQQKAWVRYNRKANSVEDDEPNLADAVDVQRGEQFDRFIFANGDEVIRFHEGVHGYNFDYALSAMFAAQGK